MREQRTKVNRGQPMLIEQRRITKVKREIIRHYGSSKGTPKEAEDAAKRILELLKPHLKGEFPREAAEKGTYAFLMKYRDKLDKNWPEASKIFGRLMQDLVKDICDNLERLWNGEKP